MKKKVSTWICTLSLCGVLSSANAQAVTLTTPEKVNMALGVVQAAGAAALAVLTSYGAVQMEESSDYLAKMPADDQRKAESERLLSARDTYIGGAVLSAAEFLLGVGQFALPLIVERPERPLMFGELLSFLVMGGSFGLGAYTLSIVNTVCDPDTEVFGANGRCSLDAGQLEELKAQLAPYRTDGANGEAIVAIRSILTALDVFNFGWGYYIWHTNEVIEASKLAAAMTSIDGLAENVKSDIRAAASRAVLVRAKSLNVVLSTLDEATRLEVTRTLSSKGGEEGVQLVSKAL